MEKDVVTHDQRIGTTYLDGKFAFQYKELNRLLYLAYRGGADISQLPADMQAAIMATATAEERKPLSDLPSRDRMAWDLWVTAEKGTSTMRCYQLADGFIEEMAEQHQYQRKWQNNISTSGEK